LVNGSGQVVMRKTIDHDGTVSIKTIRLDKMVAAGIYHLQVINNNETFNKTIVIE
jgi:hypothetical protein